MKICDSIPNSAYNSYKRDCWEKMVTLYPNVDLCSWSKEANLKNTCLFYTNEKSKSQAVIKK